MWTLKRIFSSVLVPLNWTSSPSPLCTAAAETRGPGGVAASSRPVYSQTPSVVLSPPPLGGSHVGFGSQRSPTKQTKHQSEATQKNWVQPEKDKNWLTVKLGLGEVVCVCVCVTCSLMFLWSSSCSLSVCTWFSISTLLRISALSWFFVSVSTPSTWWPHTLLKHTATPDTLAHFRHWICNIHLRKSRSFWTFKRASPLERCLLDFDIYLLTCCTCTLVDFHLQTFDIN